MQEDNRAAAQRDLSWGKVERAKVAEGARKVHFPDLRRLQVVRVKGLCVRGAVWEVAALKVEEAEKKLVGVG